MVTGKPRWERGMVVLLHSLPGEFSEKDSILSLSRLSLFEKLLCMWEIIVIQTATEPLKVNGMLFVVPS